ncbi:MAG: isoprenoid biosynthesis glyoxalase ElbB [Acidobacteria bacterium]|nr:isoprenoid biosynthesis glyoxalase ElbB [Acidobacteriota bacterium]
MSRKKIGVLLAGCGVKDGSEIHEATLSLYFLSKHDAEIVCMAPNKTQADVVNHVSEEAMGETRNVMIEAARIARGDIRDVGTVTGDEIDGIIIPGGFGAAKNLCTFASEGADCSADEDVSNLLQALYAARKPIGALCIAPTLLAQIFGKSLSVELTIGSDPETASALEKMGAKHTNAKVDEIVVDGKNRIVTTPCYMLAQSIKEVGDGVEKLVVEILKMADR